MVRHSRIKMVATVLAICILSGVAAASPEGKAAAALVEQASFQHYLAELLYAHDGDDRSLTGAEHDLARNNIVATLSSFGLTVALEPVNVQGTTYHNVVATKPGVLHPDQEYIIGAHFDSVNDVNPEVGAPGADDNASGVALVLEVARVLSQYDSDYTIRFVAFDAFEGLAAGSAAYVTAHGGDDVLGFINVDMVVHNIGTDGVWLSSMRTASFGFRDTFAEAVVTYGDGLVVESVSSLNDQLMFEDTGWPASTLYENEPLSNLTVHTAADSLDTPGYVDYDYATRITRAVVGTLVDLAVTYVDLPNADYDGDSDVDANDFSVFESCFAGPDVPVNPPCDFFDFGTDNDVDCADWRLFEAVWTEAGYPPVFRQCIPALIRPSGEARGNRCLTVTAPEHGWPMALRLTVGPDDPATSCIQTYVQSDGRLNPTPVFQPFEAWGMMVLSDDLVVPGTAFALQCDYGEPEAPLLSAPHWITTPRWGDTVGDFLGAAWTAPNGVVDFNDISSIVDAFRHSPTAPPTIQVDLVGASGSECVPDLNIDFLDISAAVDAFKGFSYWETTSCPTPCE